MTRLVNPFGQRPTAAPVTRSDSRPVGPPAPPPDGPGVGPRLELFVPGVPRPQGSKSPKGRRRNGSVILVESSAELKPWRAAVAERCRQTGVRFSGAVTVSTRFVLPRPASGPRSVPGAPADSQTAGDGDKLTRAVWDALKIAGVIEDDGKIVDWHGGKRLADAGEPTGVQITVGKWTK